MLINQNTNSNLLTPGLSSSIHTVTPDSELGPHSPPTQRFADSAIIDDFTSPSKRTQLTGKDMLAVPADLHGADAHAGSDGSPAATSGANTAASDTGALNTGALATGGDTAELGHGPNLGFPFPNGESCHACSGEYALMHSPTYIW